MSKYEVLDKAVLSRIPLVGQPGAAPVRLISIFAKDVSVECERIAAEEGGGKEAFRVLDRRLQAMRKAGILRAGGKGWVRLR